MSAGESVSFDRLADRYDQTRGYPEGVPERIAEALIAAGSVPPGGAMLEIGIGTGRIALPLLARGVNVTGVDISARMTERLREKYAAERTARDGAAREGAAREGASWGRLTVELADMTALPFADGAFDATVAVHVLHLVPAWQRALDEARRVTRRGGALLLGWDTLQSTSLHSIKDEWQKIVRGLGFPLRRVGAQDSSEVLGELRARGLAVEERIATTWTFAERPREELESVTKREWSMAWLVPDDIFAESARRLESWAQAEYGAALDRPVAARSGFKLFVVQVR